MIPVQDNILYIGKLITSSECVPPSTAVRHVADRFFNSAHMDAVALVEGREPVGLVTRNKLLFTLFRRYGFELYERKPIITIADTGPLTIYEGERLDVAIDKALDRPAEDIYDEVIVVDDNWHYKGLLSVKQMVVQQSNALANSVVQKEMASERAISWSHINPVFRSTGAEYILCASDCSLLLSQKSSQPDALHTDAESPDMLDPSHGMLPVPE